MDNVKSNINAYQKEKKKKTAKRRMNFTDMRRELNNHKNRFKVDQEYILYGFDDNRKKTVVKLPIRLRNLSRFQYHKLKNKKKQPLLS
jgi:hypothetical protein